MDKIRAKYGVKGEGQLEFVLGIEVIQKEDCIMLGQKAYVEKLLQRHNMSDCKGVKTPISPSFKLTKDDGSEPANESEYRSIIGGLAYCMTGSRPDIAFAVSKLSSYLNYPTKTHLGAAKHILRYLSATKDFYLCYPKNGEAGWEIWSDSDWGGCLDFKNALVHEDNKPCIQIANNPVLTQRCKSIDIPYHHARDHIKAGTFKTNKVASEEQLADCLIKALPPPKLAQNFRISLSSCLDVDQATLALNALRVEGEC